MIKLTICRDFAPFPLQCSRLPSVHTVPMFCLLRQFMLFFLMTDQLSSHLAALFYIYFLFLLLLFFSLCFLVFICCAKHCFPEQIKVPWGVFNSMIESWDWQLIISTFFFFFLAISEWDGCLPLTATEDSSSLQIYTLITIWVGMRH